MCGALARTFATVSRDRPDPLRQTSILMTGRHMEPAIKQLLRALGVRYLSTTRRHVQLFRARSQPPMLALKQLITSMAHQSVLSQSLFMRPCILGRTLTCFSVLQPSSSQLCHVWARRMDHDRIIMYRQSRQPPVLMMHVC